MQNHRLRLGNVESKDMRRMMSEKIAQPMGWRRSVRPKTHRRRKARESEMERVAAKARG